MLAHQQRVRLKRRGATIGQIVARGAGADHDQFAVPEILQFIRPSVQAQTVLPEKPLNGFLRQCRMVRGQTPVNVEVTIGVDRDDPFHAASAAQRDPSLFEVNLGFG